MQKLPESELDIMLALWESDIQPVPRTYFDAKLKYKGWTVNALNSFLSRLEDKGFIKSLLSGKSKYYSANVMRSDYLSRESRGILNKLFRGSLKNFLLSITEMEEDLDEKDIEELQQYIDERKASHAKISASLLAPSGKEAQNK